MNPKKNASPSLRISLLGPPQLLWQGVAQTALLVKARALLFYLALNPQPHTRTALATLLWSDMPDEKARANLRTALNRLRKPFGDYISADRQSIAFDGDAPYWLDVELFESGLVGSSPVQLRQVIELYRGEFLADFYARGAPVFEEWMLLQRERLRHLALEGIATLAEQSGKQGDLGQAIADWRRLLALDPWRESAHLALMRLLARTGDRAAALAQFEQCQRLLATEIGVAPAPATMALYGQIKDDSVTWWQGDKVTEIHPAALSSTSPDSGPCPHNLPAAATSFHGRSHELSQIQETLQQSDCRLFTVMGLGGSGKTRLALAAARHLVEAGGSLFADGIYWVPLAAIETWSGVLSAIADAIDFAFSGPAKPEDQLLAYLRNKRLLLLLDNWEQLVAEAPYLADLLQAVPRLKLLLTSREQLNLSEEWLLALEGLPFPKNGHSDPITFDAVQLFAQRARRANLNFDLAAEMAGALQICRLVEGLPLGLELAASWVQTFSCTAIAAAMAEDQEELATRVQNVPERHRSLQIAFEYSWQLLTVEEQAVLMRLAVFRGDFTWEAAEIAVGATRRVLANLVGKSLVRKNENGRYHMHEQLRQFAWEKCAPASQQETMTDHVAYFAAWLQQREMAINTSGQSKVIAAIKADVDNIRFAWETAIAERNNQLLEKMAGTLFHFYMKQGLRREGVRVFGGAVAMMQGNGRETDDAQQAFLGRLLIYQGRCGELTSQNFAEPRQTLTQGLVVARQRQQAEDVALALLGLGQLSVMSGDSPQADVYLQESIAICRSASLPWTLASALNLLAWISNAQKLPIQAKKLCAEAIALQLELGDTSGAAAALTTMGIIQSDLGEYAAAEKAYAEVLGYCRQSEHLVGIAQALTGLFVASYQQGDYEKAAVYAQESLAVNQDAGDRLGMAIAHHNLGFLAASANQHQQAVAQFRQALDIYQAAGANLLRSSNTHRYMAASMIALGQLESAREQLRVALDMVPEQGWSSQGVEILLSCGQLFLKLDQDVLARDLLTFLRDDETILPSAREQASDILAARSFASGPSRYQMLAEVISAVRLQLSLK